MPKSKYIHMGFFGLVFLIILIVAIRIISWNNRTTEVDTTDDESFFVDNLDYKVYQPIKDKDGDGKANVLFIGNNALVSGESDLNIPDIVKEKADCNVTSLIAVNSTFAESINEQYNLYDWGSFSCVAIVDALMTKDTTHQEEWIYEGHYVDETRQREYLNLLKTIDLDDIDILVLAYSFNDFYYSVPMPEFFNPDYPKRTYIGALNYVLPTLHEAYPDLKIIISSPTMAYSHDSEGNRILASELIVNQFTGSQQVMVEYDASVQYPFLSFVDNFFWKITEKNYQDYVIGFNLNDDGIRLVADHIIEFLN